MDECLLEEFRGYGDLEQLLAQEEEALLSLASERIAEIAALKEPLTRRLAWLSACRTAVLKLERLPPDADGMREWISRHPEHTTAAKTWGQLVKRAEHARRRNEINGRVIAALICHLRARLNLISSSLCANPTYGSDGHARLSRPHFPLAQA